MFGWSGTSERASWYPSTDSVSSVELHDPCLYARAGYPLVYYAQVEPGGGPVRSRPLTKKDNPNCFVKAFRWYTQEHNVHKTANYDSETDEKKGYPGFATWLDQKYDQFLKDRRLKNDPSLSAAQLNGQSPIQQNRTKRTYLPWKKRRRALNSQDGGHRSEKCSQSFETILHPKVLTHPASERCVATKTATGYDSSKITMTLSDTRIISKISGQRCQGSESEEKEMHVTTTEAFAGGTEFKQSTTQVGIRNSQYNFLRGPQKSLEKKHVECQCKQYMVTEHGTCLCPTEYVECQCEPDIVTERLTCLCPNKLAKKAKTSDQLEKKDIKNNFSSSSPIPITSVLAVRTRFQAQSTKIKTKGVICECRLFEKHEVEWRCPASRSIEANAQTSDHVVALVNPSPFLLRVVDVAALAAPATAPARAPPTTNNTCGL